jgi:hemolysin activation/secretion protein
LFVEFRYDRNMENNLLKLTSEPGRWCLSSTTFGLIHLAYCAQPVLNFRLLARYQPLRYLFNQCPATNRGIKILCKFPGVLLALLGTILSLTFVNAVQAQVPKSASENIVRLLVSAVEIQGNTLLPENELSKMVSHLVGAEQTLDDLQRAASTVQQAYRKAGYGGVVAFVPEQDLAGGKVLIRIIEGKLARVKIANNHRLDNANIRRSLPNLKEGTTPRVASIDRDIQLANENPIKELQVKLAPGSNPGEIDAAIDVVEDKPLRFLVGLDNTGSKPTGNYRISVGLQHANLWNRDHIGTIQYQTSPTEPDLVHIYSLGYRLPIYGYSSSVDAYYAHSSVDNGTTTTPAGSLQFTGTGDVAGLKLNRYLPRMGEYDHRFTLGIDWRDFDNECSVGTLGAAGCGSAGVSVAALPISIAYTGQVEGPNLTWGSTLSLAYNVGGSGQGTFESARANARKHYTVLRLSAFTARTLAKGFGLQARVSAQYSPDALISGEQQGLGGSGNVRGYREREIAGDYGFFANLEGLGPDLGKKFQFSNTNLRPLVFLDYGRVTNHNSTPCHQTQSGCSASSVGIGARLGIGKWLSGRFDVGYALQDGNQSSTGSTIGHFALNLVF